MEHGLRIFGGGSGAATPGESLSVVAAASTAQTIDLKASSSFDVTASAASCAITPTVTSPVAGKAYAATILLRQDATGGRVWTFPGSVVWAATPTFSTTPNAIDTVTMVTTDGGTTFLSYGPVASVPSNTFSSIWAPPFGFSNFTSVLVANTLYVVSIVIGFSSTLNGLQISNDSPVSGNVKIALYNAAGSALLASSGSVAVATTFHTQLVPFTTPATVPPGVYKIAYIPDNATSKFVVSDLPVACGTVSPGSFVIPSSITPPAANTRTGNFPVMATY